MSTVLRILCLVAFALLVGNSDAALAQTALAKASLRLDWKGGAQHSPFYLAKERGYYKDEGIDLTIISGSGSSDVVKQVGSKAIEFGVADALVLVQAAEQRVPVKAISAYYQRTPIVVISPQAKPITEPKQLTQGVKLGLKKGSATFQGLTALLAANSIPMDQVSLVDIGFGVQPLLLKQVDAMMGFSMNEPVEAEAAGLAVTTMPIADHGVDAYGLMVVSNPDLIARNPALVKGFLRATIRGIKDVIQDPAAGVAAVTKNIAESDASRESMVVARTIPFFSDGGTLAQLGQESAQRWEHTIEMAKKVGLVERGPATDTMFTNELLPR